MIDFSLRPYFRAGLFYLLLSMLAGCSSNPLYEGEASPEKTKEYRYIDLSYPPLFAGASYSSSLRIMTKDGSQISWRYGFDAFGVGSYCNLHEAFICMNLERMWSFVLPKSKDHITKEGWLYNNIVYKHDGQISLFWEGKDRVVSIISAYEQDKLKNRFIFNCDVGLIYVFSFPAVETAIDGMQVKDLELVGNVFVAQEGAFGEKTCGGPMRSESSGANLR